MAEQVVEVTEQDGEVVVTVDGVPKPFGCKGSANVFAQAVAMGKADTSLLRPCFMSGHICGMLHVVKGIVR